MSRWGSVSKVLERVGPYSKVFFVGDSDDTGFVDFVNEFPPDKDGVVRVYSSMFDSTMLANARAGRGDVIMVMPGHLESISADQAINVKGLKLIGLGEGDERPRIQYDSAAASISLDTGGIHLENFRLIASVTAVTLGIDVVGDGCVVKKCSLEFDSNGDDFAIGMTVSGNRGTIEENEILGEDTVGPTHGIQLSSSNYTKVRRNYIIGQFSNAGISDTAASQGLLIGENFISNQDTASSITISLTTTSRGIVYNNRMATS
ncbi:MAG: NosD domain-containing protein, partial [Nanoarchaeota archaeon]